MRAPFVFAFVVLSSSSSILVEGAELHGLEEARAAADMTPSTDFSALLDAAKAPLFGNAPHGALHGARKGFTGEHGVEGALSSAKLRLRKLHDDEGISQKLASRDSIEGHVTMTSHADSAKEAAIEAAVHAATTAHAAAMAQGSGQEMHAAAHAQATEAAAAAVEEAIEAAVHTAAQQAARAAAAAAGSAPVAAVSGSPEGSIAPIEPPAEAAGSAAISESTEEDASGSAVVPNDTMQDGAAGSADAENTPKAAGSTSSPEDGAAGSSASGSGAGSEDPDGGSEPAAGSAAPTSPSEALGVEAAGSAPPESATETAGSAAGSAAAAVNVTETAPGSAAGSSAQSGGSAVAPESAAPVVEGSAAGSSASAGYGQYSYGYGTPEGPFSGDLDDVTDFAKRLDAVEEHLAEHMAEKSAGNSWDALLQKHGAAVVQILAVKMDDEEIWLQPQLPTESKRSSGTGWFIDNHHLPRAPRSELFIVTNAHVVVNAMSLHIRHTALNKEPIEVEVVGLCDQRDLALLRVLEPKRLRDLVRERTAGWDYDCGHMSCHSEHNIHKLRLGHSDDMHAGDKVVALGFPLGFNGVKITMGVFSGYQVFEHSMYAQMDAAINPGNSGGPLLSAQGAVLGINSAKMTDADGVSFAIPTAVLTALLPDLYTHRELILPFLGLKFNLASADTASYLQMPPTAVHSHHEGTLAGVLVKSVTEGGLFAAAGVERGDYVLSVDRHKVDRFGQFLVQEMGAHVNLFGLMARKPIGAPLNITVWRASDASLVELSTPYSLTEEKPLRLVNEVVLHPPQYEIFGGIVFSQLTLNLAIELLKQDINFDAIYPYTEESHRDKQVLVVVDVISGSVAEGALGGGRDPSTDREATVPGGKSALEIGQVVSKVNGVPVSTVYELCQQMQLTDQRFAPHRTNEYWTVEGSMGNLAVFRREHILAAKAKSLFFKDTDDTCQPEPPAPPVSAAIEAAVLAAGSSTVIDAIHHAGAAAGSAAYSAAVDAVGSAEGAGDVASAAAAASAAAEGAIDTAVLDAAGSATGSAIVLPTTEPTAQPTTEPTTEAPTSPPTAQPTTEPTAMPTTEPTAQPSAAPTPQPTFVPTPQPTAEPTPVPTVKPTPKPSPSPTVRPTEDPTAQPTTMPTKGPTASSTQDDDSGTQDDDSGTQDDSSGNQDDSSGNQDDSSGTQDDDPGTQDDDSGTQDDSSGTQDDDSGNQDDSSGTQDDDSGTQDEGRKGSRFEHSG